MLPGRIRLALAAVVAGGLLAATNGILEVRRLKGPIEATSGIITSLDYAEGRRSTSVWLLLADGREVVWTCRLPSCMPSVRALKGLAWETPMPADMQFVAGRLVGLTIREAEVIDAEQNLALRVSSNVFGAILGAGFALAAASGLYFGRDRHRLRPRGRSSRRISS